MMFSNSVAASRATIALLGALLSMNAQARPAAPVSGSGGADRSERELHVDGSIAVWSSCSLVGGFSRSSCEIYAFDAANPEAGPRRLTDNAVEDSSPRVSGSRVIWMRVGSRDSEIILLDLESGGETPLTNNDDDEFLPDVSLNNAVWWRRDSVNTDLFFLTVYDLSAGTSVNLQFPNPFDLLLSRPVIEDGFIPAVLERASFDIWIKDSRSGGFQDFVASTGTDERNLDLAVGLGWSFFPTFTSFPIPFLVWEREVTASRNEILLWNGTSTTLVRSGSLNYVKPTVSWISAGLLANSTPTMAWENRIPDTDTELPLIEYCLQCDGAHNHLIDSSRKDQRPDILGQWIVFERDETESQEIIFFDAETELQLRLTKDNKTDKIPLLGSRLAEPGERVPVIFWVKGGTFSTRIWYVPEPGPDSLALCALAVMSAIARNRRCRA